MLEDDGLPVEQVKAHSEGKYRLISSLAGIFATGMKLKWDVRVYVDLFAASGRARIEGSGRLVAGSPIQALSIRDPFDLYVFCEMDGEKLNALRTRVDAIGQSHRCTFVHGDCNSSVAEIIGAIPGASRERKVLSLCIVDPYRLEDLKFSTIAQLATRFFDFLCLLPTYMDGNRNLSTYIDAGNATIAEYLGNPAWRENWNVHPSGLSFGDFLLVEFIRSMESISYLHGNLCEIEPVKIEKSNVRLYHLPYFSRHQRGIEFWRKAKQSSSDQLELF